MKTESHDGVVKPSRLAVAPFWRRIMVIAIASRLASGQRSVAVYMLSRVVHDDKSLVVSSVVCMLTLDALCADSDIGSSSVGYGICRESMRSVLFEV
jgi:hypothetical protein